MKLIVELKQRYLLYRKLEIGDNDLRTMFGLSIFEISTLDRLAPLYKEIAQLFIDETFRDLNVLGKTIDLFKYLQISSSGYRYPPRRTTLDILIRFKAATIAGSSKQLKLAVMFECLGFGKLAFGDLYAPKKDAFALLMTALGYPIIYTPYSDASSIGGYYEDLASTRYIGHIAPYLKQKFQVDEYSRALAIGLHNGLNYMEIFERMSRTDAATVVGSDGQSHALLDQDGNPLVDENGNPLNWWEVFGFDDPEQAIALQEAFGLKVDKDNGNFVEPIVIRRVVNGKEQFEINDVAFDHRTILYEKKDSNGKLTKTIPILHDMRQWWANLLQSGMAEFQLPMIPEFAQEYNSKRAWLKKFFAIDLGYGGKPNNIILQPSINELLALFLRNSKKIPVNPFYPIAQLDPPEDRL
ncbi:MAG: hypothetical protein K9W44_17715 [Candidatus Lokiarchaeota archaeon]|nr:hypothetical protein [Candidatus Harpocratesius repetitus]